MDLVFPPPRRHFGNAALSALPWRQIGGGSRRLCDAKCGEVWQSARAHKGLPTDMHEHTLMHTHMRAHYMRTHNAEAEITSSKVAPDTHTRKHTSTPLVPGADMQFFASSVSVG